MFPALRESFLHFMRLKAVLLWTLHVTHSYDVDKKQKQRKLLKVIVWECSCLLQFINTHFSCTWKMGRVFVIQYVARESEYQLQILQKNKCMVIKTRPHMYTIPCNPMYFFSLENFHWSVNNKKDVKNLTNCPKQGISLSLSFCQSFLFTPPKRNCQLIGSLLCKNYPRLKCDGFVDPFRRSVCMCLHKHTSHFLKG